MKYKLFILKLIERDGPGKTADILSDIMIQSDQLYKMQNEFTSKLKNLGTFSESDADYIKEHLTDIGKKSSEIMQAMINASIGDESA